MANPTIFPSNIQWVGLAKETTYGTAVAAPTVWVPVVGPKWMPNQTNIIDDALRGNMVVEQGMVAGIRYDEVTYSCYGALSNLFQHMAAILGYPDAVAGTAAPYTHATAVQNAGDGQPVSYTVFLYNGAETWQMPGSKIPTLDIEWKPEALVKLAVTWRGLVSTKMVANPTNTPDTTAPMPSWNTTVSTGSADSTRTGLKLSLKRNDANAIFTHSGSQAPYEVFLGALSMDGELTGVYQGYAGSPTDLSNYLTNVQPALSIQTNPVGDAIHYGKWTMSKAGYSGVEVSGQSGYMQVSSKLKPLANSTDGLGATVSNVKYTQVDTVSTSY